MQIGVKASSTFRTVSIFIAGFAVNPFRLFVGMRICESRVSLLQGYVARYG